VNGRLDWFCVKGGVPIYAIVRSGGKQYRVEVGSKINVERLAAAEGDKVELSDVLLLADGGQVTTGNPTVAGAKVTAQVVEHGRSPKAVVFKYKAKVRYRRRTGHRQPFTRLAVEEIVAPGVESVEAVEPKKSRRSRAKKQEESEG
jgi:large subunit ribosomal protein L21